MTSEKSSNPAVWAGIEPPDGHLLAWRVVHPDGRSRNGFRWPFKGAAKVPAEGILRENTGPCPIQDGDGLCLAKTWLGARQGGIPAITGLAVAYRERDVLGEDDTKLRVSRCWVLDVLDLPRLLREGHGRGAYLTGAYLYGAYLSGAYLSGADLRGADLRGAYLSGADLRGAYLYGADLYGANLSGADLTRADLTRADLSGADLRGADLREADLRGAYLSGAYLRGADLRGAYLYGADLSRADLRGARNVPAHAQQAGKTA